MDDRLIPLIKEVSQNIGEKTDSDWKILFALFLIFLKELENIGVELRVYLTHDDAEKFYKDLEAKLAKNRQN